MKRLPKIIRVLIWSTLALVGVIFLAYAVENWRGAQAWATTAAKLDHYDISLSLGDLVSPSVPAETNFWTTPLLAGIENSDNEDSEERIMEIMILDESETGADTNFEAGPSIATKALTNFDLWAERLGQPDSDGARLVFDTLQSKFGDRFDELVAAAKRPNAQTTTNFAEIDSFVEMISLELPHYTRTMHLGRQIDLLTLAALRLGESEIALDLLRVRFRLGETLAHDPMLLSHLVVVVQRVGACHVVWEGLAQNAWSPQQLLEIESELRRVDIIANFARVSQAELGMQVSGMDFLKRSDLREVEGLMGPGQGAGALRVIPKGWLDQNKVTSANWMLERTILPARDRDWAALTRDIEYPNNKWNPLFLLRAVDGSRNRSVTQKTCHTHMLIELAQAACALERHRLKHGAFPEKLPSELIDVDGQPIRYAVDGAEFRLYSVGWNLQDDGGETVLKQKGRGKGLNLDEGDWVWAYP